MSMRRSWEQRRARLFAGAARDPKSNAAARRPATGRRRTELVGRDFSDPQPRSPGRSRLRGAVLLALLLTALPLAALRVEILRLRYRLAEAVTEEERLFEHERAAIVELRRARDPNRLRRLAHELGFTRPERVIQLHSPRREADS